jgi:hypothetical protein
MGEEENVDKTINVSLRMTNGLPDAMGPEMLRIVRHHEPPYALAHDLALDNALLPFPVPRFQFRVSLAP